MVRLAHAGTLVIAPATAITAHMLVYDKISQGIEDRQADPALIAESCDMFCPNNAILTFARTPNSLQR